MTTPITVLESFHPIPAREVFATDLERAQDRLRWVHRMMNPKPLLQVGKYADQMATFQTGALQNAFSQEVDNPELKIAQKDVDSAAGLLTRRDGLLDAYVRHAERRSSRSADQIRARIAGERVGDILIRSAVASLALREFSTSFGQNMTAIELGEQSIATEEFSGRGMILGYRYGDGQLLAEPVFQGVFTTALELAGATERPELVRPTLVPPLSEAEQPIADIIPFERAA